MAEVTVYREPVPRIAIADRLITVEPFASNRGYELELSKEGLQAPSSVPDTTPPVVTLVSPTDRHVDPGESIVFDVTDNLGDFARILFAVAFPSLGTTELVHDGTNFVDRYTAASSRVVISNGWRYTLSRFGGWPASPRARIFVTDGEGNNES